MTFYFLYEEQNNYNVHIASNDALMNPLRFPPVSLTINFKKISLKRKTVLENDMMTICIESQYCPPLPKTSQCKQANANKPKANKAKAKPPTHDV